MCCGFKSIVLYYILYLSAVCMLRISRKFVAIQMKSIMVIGAFISYDFMLGHTFRSIIFAIESTFGQRRA